MLPDDFQWQAHMDGHALCLDGRIIATYCQRPGAPYALAYLHCDTARLTSRTFLSEQAARAYLEAWARKWQAKLREEYGLLRAAKQAQHPSGFGVAMRSSDPKSG